LKRKTQLFGGGGFPRKSRVLIFSKHEGRGLSDLLQGKKKKRRGSHRETKKTGLSEEKFSKNSGAE